MAIACLISRIRLGATFKMRLLNAMRNAILKARCKNVLVVLIIVNVFLNNVTTNKTVVASIVGNKCHGTFLLSTITFLMLFVVITTKQTWCFAVHSVTTLNITMSQNPTSTSTPTSQPKITCLCCQTTFVPRRKWQRYCSPTCRTKAFWQTHKVVILRRGD